jgi:hypothetical protein
VNFSGRKRLAKAGNIEPICCSLRLITQRARVQNPARGLNPRAGTTGRCRSWLIAPGRAAVCKNLQDVPEQASTIGIGWQSRGRADADLPGSAAVCCHCLLPVTPEAAGWSPVDPANYNASVEPSSFSEWPKKYPHRPCVTSTLPCHRAVPRRHALTFHRLGRSASWSESSGATASAGLSSVTPRPRSLTTRRTCASARADESQGDSEFLAGKVKTLVQGRGGVGSAVITSDRLAAADEALWQS